jgi:iron-sulfur cluster insertion protein
MNDMTVATPEAKVGITESAARRLATLIAAEPGDGLMFRVAVTGGGCSGFQYNFSFDDTRQDDDLVFGRDGVTVLVDAVSLDLLKGAEIDYVEDLVGASFQVRNPNATASCGCGNSFAA